MRDASEVDKTRGKVSKDVLGVELQRSSWHDAGTRPPVPCPYTRLFAPCSSTNPSMHRPPPLRIPLQSQRSSEEELVGITNLGRSRLLWVDKLTGSNAHKPGPRLDGFHGPESYRSMNPTAHRHWSARQSRHTLPPWPMFPAGWSCEGRERPGDGDEAGFIGSCGLPPRL